MGKAEAALTPDRAREMERLLKGRILRILRAPAAGAQLVVPEVPSGA
ncbi:MAG: hypothetical protein R3E12_12875 [Candidatus Eisenbacteria bacterium]